MAHDVFISYSSHDKATADAVCATLEARGVRCWIAPRDVRPGAEWAASIIDAIGESRVFLLVLSSSANGSTQVAREIERAANRGLVILPFRIEDTPPSKAIEYFVSNHHWLDALTPPLERHLRHLADTVQHLLAASALAPGPSPAPIEPTRPAGAPTPSPIPPPPADGVTDWLGRNVGGYILGEVLGQGGSGVVYKAVHARLGRVACVKVLHPLAGDAAAVGAAIALGARALASLDDRSIVELYDFGETDLGGRSRHYLAMEYVDGPTLDRWCVIAPEPTMADKLRLAARLARAVAVTHACTYLDEIGMQRTGLLHGDIKPTNVLVRRDGSPVLLDFLLADVQRRVDPAALPADAGARGSFITAAFGTPGYMPPEQERGVLTPQSDVYGLAATVCYTLFPFHGDAKAAIREVALPGLPETTRMLLLAMLAPDPADRPRDLGAVAAEFERAAQGGWPSPGHLAPPTGLPPAGYHAPDPTGVPTTIVGGAPAFPPPGAAGATPTSIPTTVTGAWTRVPPTTPPGWPPTSADDRSGAGPAAIPPTQPPSGIPAGASPMHTAPPIDYRVPTYVPPTRVPGDPAPPPPWGFPVQSFAGPPDHPGATVDHAAPPTGEAATTGAIGPATVDAVQFTVTAPPAVAPGTAFVLSVWAHLGPQFDAVVERARAAFGPAHAPVGTKGPLSVRRGVLLTVRLKLDGMAVDEPEDTLLWTGEIGNATFAVRVPPDAAPGDRAGQAAIYAGGLRLGRVNFTLGVAASAPPSPGLPLPSSTERHRRAFVSYARPDSREVLARIQGIQKAAPDMEVFLDTLTLRSGQFWERELWNVIPRSDVFYLFWSKHARASEWVEREWRCALEARGIDFIDPVPLDPPQAAPPPPELSGKHFDDWALAFSRGLAAAQKPPSLSERLKGAFGSLFKR